jgi:hypothetical protein
LAICRRTIARAEKAGRCTVIGAAAGVRSGSVWFEAGLGGRSRVADGPGAGAIAVPVADVMALIATADLVKIDIEGSEWPLLADERLGEGGPDAVVLEYHPNGCPAGDPGVAARQLLEAAGYRLVPPPRPFYADEFPSGQGMLWAAR